MNTDPKFYLNPTKINLNMIILMLLSQYFHNKCYMASYNWFLFEPIINFTFYLPLTTYHLNFVIKFLWKYCVLNIIKKKKFLFCSFVKNICIFFADLLYFTFVILSHFLYLSFSLLYFLSFSLYLIKLFDKYSIDFQVQNAF